MTRTSRRPERRSSVSTRPGTSAPASRGWWRACGTLPRCSRKKNSIYATSVNLTPQADGTFKGKLDGKAAREQDILGLRDHMTTSNKGFINVSNPDTRRETNRGTGDEFTFSISFIYKPTE